uniref:Uncharacterized protein n=1 Tax=Mustela putorius furo TaxID=9669 RepID=M3YWW3_MUSPF
LVHLPVYILPNEKQLCLWKRAISVPRFLSAPLTRRNGCCSLEEPGGAHLHLPGGRRLRAPTGGAGRGGPPPPGRLSGKEGARSNVLHEPGRTRPGLNWRLGTPFLSGDPTHPWAHHPSPSCPLTPGQAQETMNKVGKGERTSSTTRQLLRREATIFQTGTAKLGRDRRKKRVMASVSGKSQRGVPGPYAPASPPSERSQHRAPPPKGSQWLWVGCPHTPTLGCPHTPPNPSLRTLCTSSVGP